MNNEQNSINENRIYSVFCIRLDVYKDGFYFEWCFENTSNYAVQCICDQRKWNYKNSGAYGAAARIKFDNKKQSSNAMSKCQWSCYKSAIMYCTSNTNKNACTQKITREKIGIILWKCVYLILTRYLYVHTHNCTDTAFEDWKDSTVKTTKCKSKTKIFAEIIFK